MTNIPIKLIWNRITKCPWIKKSSESSNSKNDKYSNEFDFESYLQKKYRKNHRENKFSNEKYCSPFDRGSELNAQVPYDQNTGELPDTDFRNCFQRLKKESNDFKDRKYEENLLNSPTFQEMEIIKDTEIQFQTWSPIRYYADAECEIGHTKAEKRLQKKHNIKIRPQPRMSRKKNRIDLKRQFNQKKITRGKNAAVNHKTLLRLTVKQVNELSNDENLTRRRRMKSEHDVNIKTKVQTVSKSMKDCQFNANIIRKSHQPEKKINDKTSNMHFDTGKLRLQRPLVNTENRTAEINPLRKRSTRVLVPMTTVSTPFRNWIPVPSQMNEIQICPFPRYLTILVTQPPHIRNINFIYPCLRDHSSEFHIRLASLGISLANGNIQETDQNYGRDHDPTDYIHLSALSRVNIPDHPANSNQNFSVQGSQDDNRVMRLGCFVDYQSETPCLRLTDESLARISRQIFETFHFHIDGTGRCSGRCLHVYVDNRQSVRCLRLTTESINQIYRVLNSCDFRVQIYIERIPCPNITIQGSNIIREGLPPSRQNLLPERNSMQLTCMIADPPIIVNFEVDDQNACLRLTEASYQRLRLELTNRESTASSLTSSNVPNTITFEQDHDFSFSSECCDFHYERFEPNNLPFEENHSKNRPDTEEKCKSNILLDNYNQHEVTRDSGYCSRLNTSNDDSVEGAVGGYEEPHFLTKPSITHLTEISEGKTEFVVVMYRNAVLTSIVLDETCDMQDILREIHHIISTCLPKGVGEYTIQRLGHDVLKIDDDICE